MQSLHNVRLHLFSLHLQACSAKDKLPSRCEILTQVLSYGVRSKVKCLGERPSCTACSKRGIACIYDEEAVLTPNLSRTGIQPCHIPAIDVHSAGLNMQETSSQYAEPGLTHIAYTTQKAQFPNSPNSGYGLVADYPGINLDDPFAGSGFQWDCDWIFAPAGDDHDLDFYPLPDMPLLVAPELSMTNKSDSRNEGWSATADRSVQEPLQTTSAIDADESDISLKKTTLSTYDDRENGAEGWPMEWSAEPRQVHLKRLPPLGTMFDQLKLLSHYSLPKVNSATMTNIKEKLKLGLSRVPWEEVSLNEFPDPQQIDMCLDLYFVHFDEVSNLDQSSPESSQLRSRVVLDN